MNRLIHRLLGIILASSTAVAAAPPTPEMIAKIEQAAPVQAPAQPAKGRKLLVFNKPAGFRHSSIETGTAAMKILGEKTGAFSVEATDDPQVFSADRLKDFDAICLMNTTGSFLTSEGQKQALMEFVRGGKGIVGIHSASDAHYDWDDYGMMIGGWFAGHPWNAGDTVTVKLDEPNHPINKSFGGQGFSIMDEIYQFRIWPYSRKRSRVLLSLDNAKTPRKPNMNRGPDGDYAVAWIHKFGEGRVFYCSLGHREDVYWNPAVLAHYLAGIQYAMGDLKVDDSPSEAGEPEPKPHARLIERLKTFTAGDDPSVIDELEALARQARGDVDATAKMEWAMLAILADKQATTEAKREVARRIWMVGADSSVIALGGFLPDEDLAHSARYSLERIDHPYVAFFMVQALGVLTGPLRVGVINSLATRREQAAVPKLAELLNDADLETRRAAVAALGRIGGPAAAKAIGEARAAGDAQMRDALTDAYLSIADQFLEADKKELAAAIFRDLFAADQPPHVRIAALRGLVETSDNGIGLLVEQLGGDDRPMKVVAARMLQETRDPRATAAILAAMETASPMVQAVLADALARRGDRSAAPALAKLATSADAGAKLHAIKGLGRLGGDQHVDLLAATAAESRGELRDAARASLATLRGAAVNERILAALSSAAPERAVELVRALGERQADEAVAPLVKLAGSHVDPRVRREAFRVLGALAPADRLADVIQALTRESDSSVLPIAERAVLSIAQRAPTPEQAVAAVLAARQQLDGSDRAALLRILSQLGGSQALEAVRQDLQSADAGVRDAAVRALAGWPDAQAAPDLLQVARTGQGPTKILALRGYIRLAGQVDDAGARTEMYRKAMGLADRSDEKRLILAGLSQIASGEALQLARAAATDPALKAEAEQAIKRIEQSLASK